MKAIYIVLLALILDLPAVGQFLLPVKEQCDHIVHKQLYNGAFIGLTSYETDHVNSWSTYKYPEAVGQLQLGYMQMYRATKDKAYLVKFINIALRAMAWRRGNYLFTDGTMEGSTLYKNGVLLWAFSDFIHLISVEEPELQTSTLVDALLSIPTSTIPENIIPVAACSTYGSVAQWLLARCCETLDHIIANQWSDDLAFGDGGEIHGLNQEAVFGSAMLNLGHVATSTDNAILLPYLDKAAVMLRKFRYVGEVDRCACILGLPVLQNNTDNSYFWYHDGWSQPRRNNGCPFVDCNGESGWAPHDMDLRDRREFMEDISHGVYDMELPRLANLYNIYTGGSEPFADVDMVKFRNAFTTQIALPFQGSWGFCPGVYGCDALIGVYGGYWFNYYRKDAPAWMFLHQWDEAAGAAPGPGVYEILTTFYTSDLDEHPIEITSGLAYWGLAQLVAAQWERECFSLDLYNRELVYDQDFAAKNILRVFPAGEAGASFADPVIHEPRFTVNDQVHAAFRAGSAVVFEPGFEAKLGSVVEAVIDPLGCDLAYKAMLPTEYPRTEVRAPEAREQTMTEQDAPVSVEQTMERQMIDAFRLVPNPTSGETYAELQLGDRRLASLTIHDALGRQIWSGQFGTLVAGEHRHPVGIRLPFGVYHCTLTLDGVTYTQRLVVE